MCVFTLLSLSWVFIARVMSHDIGVSCHFNSAILSSRNASPSVLSMLSVEAEPTKGGAQLHIRWAINVDASNKHLVATRLSVDGKDFHCIYTPSFADANLTGLTQLWFDYDIFTTAGDCQVSAANLPLPPVTNDVTYKTVYVTVPAEDPLDDYDETQTGTIEMSTGSESGHEHGYESTYVVLAIGVVLAGLTLPALCLIFKTYRLRTSVSGDFSKLPESTQPPVSVLLVYPPECPAVQKTVVALAEFLQGHGGCSVAVDLWQQGKIAELGPMRWAAGQAEAADRVLIVCPQPISCRSNHRFLGPAIPASANDLYPLVLNMVASHAKNPSELARFWAVQLGTSQDERPRTLPGELAACKWFCLTKDLDKLCRSLRIKRQDSSIPPRPKIFYNKKSTMKLQDAIGQLAEHQSCITAEQECLNSVVITV